MAYIELYTAKLKTNYSFLESQFKQRNISWAIVTKLLCGNEEYLKQVVDLGIGEICDSRISNLATIKELNPDIETVYIKPPARNYLEDIVRYADASFNTELTTIKWLSEEAQRQNKMHKIIIMVELGDLREGVMGNELLDFYEEIFKLPNIKVTGVGSNLNCLSGVYPSEDKLIQLSLYKQLIEAKFDREINWATGGTSVVVPLLFKEQVPEGINHFRIGETLFFGKDLISDELIDGMHDDVFRLFSQIIEIHEKPKVPRGYLGENPSGESFEIDDDDYGEKSYRAIIDIGVLDISKSDFLIPEDHSIEFVGASSDMLVVDLGDTACNYKVGDLITFKLKYMGALRLFNSEYVEKRTIDD